MGSPQNLLFFFSNFYVAILMQFTEYIQLPSLNSTVLIVSAIRGFYIRTDRHDKYISVPFFAVWLRIPNNIRHGTEIYFLQKVLN